MRNDRLVVSPLERKVIEGLAASSQYAEEEGVAGTAPSTAWLFQRPLSSLSWLRCSAILFRPHNVGTTETLPPTHSSETSVAAGIRRPILIHFGLWTYGAAIRFFLSFDFVEWYHPHTVLFF